MPKKPTDTTRRIEYLPLDAIKGAAANPKDHSIDELTKSYERFGSGEAPLLDERTGRLVAGHGRVETLRALFKKAPKEPPEGVQSVRGEWLVPVQRGWASANDREAAAYLVASNRLVELGGWDQGKLNDLLSELASAGEKALEGIGYDAAFITQLAKNYQDPNDVKFQEIDETIAEKMKVKCPKCEHEFIP